LFEGEGGLKHDSVAVCHQVTTIDKSKLREKLGTLISDQLIEVENGLKAAVRIL
jgi:mRNA interferase MazF